MSSTSVVFSPKFSTYDVSMGLGLLFASWVRWSMQVVSHAVV